MHRDVASFPAESPTPPAPVLLPLAYDELPPGSDIRREYGPGGAVTITAPAGEPSAAVRRAAAQRAGVSGAVVCGVALGVGVILGVGLLDSVRRLDSGSRLLALAMFTVFCGGVFLLAWNVLYANRLNVLGEARREAAVLHADGYRLLVETAGPKGVESLDLSIADVQSMTVSTGAGWASDSNVESVPCLRVMLQSGRLLRLLSGRHETELRWVAAAVAQATGLARGGDCPGAQNLDADPAAVESI